MSAFILVKNISDDDDDAELKQTAWNTPTGYFDRKGFTSISFLYVIKLCTFIFMYRAYNLFQIESLIQKSNPLI